MSRRRTSEIEISMFPFLSVLCAVIGVLMLFIIVIISTRAIEAGPLQSYGDDGKTASTHSQRVGVDEQIYQALESQIRQLKARLAERRQEYRELRRLHAQLVDLLEAKEGEEAAPIRRPTRLSATDRVRVVPDPKRSFDLEPISVEVKADTYTVYPEKDVYPVEQLAQSGSPLRRFLDGVRRGHDKEYLLLLVRPNGVASFKELIRHVGKTYQGRVRIGFEPIPNEWGIVEQQPDAPD